MANFSAVLRKTIDGLANPTPAMRQRVYEKARATIEQKLSAANARPEAAERQRKILSEAIDEVERDYAARDAEAAAPTPAEAEPEPVADKEPETAAEPAIDPAAETAAPPEADVEPMPAPAQKEDKLRVKPARAGAQRSEFDDIFFGSEAPPEDYFPAAPADGANDIPPLPGSPRRRTPAISRRAIVALVAVIAVVGIGFAGWGMWGGLGGGGSSVTTPQKTTTPAPAPKAKANNKATADTKAEDKAVTTPEKPPEKFTQRLLPNGQEVNPGPAADKPSVGEGTSLAAQTAKPAASETPSAPAPAAAPQGTSSQPANSQTATETLPVGQKAYFYEERTGQEAGTADTGAVVWSEIEQSPGNDLPPEPAIRADVTIPDRGIKLRLTIQRNADKSLPASHLIELVFTVPDNFPGGSIDNVQRVSFKDTEQVAGNPLVAIPAKIADNFFIVALNNAPTAVSTNTTLMRREEWIDIPVTYRTGRRALITLEKGVPGDRVFDQVLKAWDEKAGG